MGNYIMRVDFFGNDIRCETEGLLVSLTDLAKAGNNWRACNGMPLRSLANILVTDAFTNFLNIAIEETKKSKEELLVVTGKGKSKRTMAHVNLAIYVAEQFSPKLHYQVIDTFVQGKLLEFREYGGTEFKELNAAIDKFLPERNGNSNTGIYINAAKRLRAKILGPEAKADAWNTASVDQTHLRYDLEKKLSTFLAMGFIKNWDHLKEIIIKL